MPMAETPMAVITGPEREEAGTEVTMAPVMAAPEVRPEPDEAGTKIAPAVNLLDQRRGLYLLRDATPPTGAATAEVATRPNPSAPAIAPSNAAFLISASCACHRTSTCVLVPSTT
jgi:hypothetical protein